VARGINGLDWPLIAAASCLGSSYSKKPKKDPRHLSAAGQIGRSRFSVLQVQGVTECPQCSFLDRFAQGWVGMDSARDIFQACAHFQ